MCIINDNNNTNYYAFYDIIVMQNVIGFQVKLWVLSIVDILKKELIESFTYFLPYDSYIAVDLISVRLVLFIGCTDRSGKSWPKIACFRKNRGIGEIRKLYKIY